MMERVGIAVLAVISTIVTFGIGVGALDNGLALTPPMGFNTWYGYECSYLMNENIVKESADIMVKTGLAELGYVYVNLDDCFISKRDANGVLQADPLTFPSGMKSLADYIHSLGLKFGLYTDRGNNTCAGRPGSGGYETIDAQTYSSWGVDFVKEDSCYASQDHETAFYEYGLMRDALNETGRPMLFSLCGWYDWYAPEGASLGNMWRTGPDDSNWAGILDNLDILSYVYEYAGSGGWNDPDMLLNNDPEGNLRLTELQTRTQFNLWSVTASPLIISSDIRKMTTYIEETWTNSEVIAINQDIGGKAGWRLQGDDLGSAGTYVKVKPCNTSSTAQWWVWDYIMEGTISNYNDQLCINMANCQESPVILYECVAGPCVTCCAQLKNQQWTFDSATGALTSQMDGHCLTIGDSAGSLLLTECETPISSVQTWKETQAGNDASIFSITQNGDTYCLSAPVPETQNVWGRPLQSGDFAIVFVNTGVTDADITCSDSCWKQTGFDSTTTVYVRDVWQHGNIGQTAGSITANAVPANGGSVMYRLSLEKY
ncbi:glycoside hydrolase family 27 protein [Pelomyxa schiedti]|nr:glycoside hydrolase family 27 protein [Pelomyxa schiedti]